MRIPLFPGLIGLAVLALGVVAAPAPSTPSLADLADTIEHIPGYTDGGPDPWDPNSLSTFCNPKFRNPTGVCVIARVEAEVGIYDARCNKIGHYHDLPIKEAMHVSIISQLPWQVVVIRSDLRFEVYYGKYFVQPVRKNTQYKCTGGKTCMALSFPCENFIGHVEETPGLPWRNPARTILARGENSMTSHAAVKQTTRDSQIGPACDDKSTFCTQPKHGKTNGYCTLSFRGRDVGIYDKRCNKIGHWDNIAKQKEMHLNIPTQLPHFIVLTRTEPDVEFLYAGQTWGKNTGHSFTCQGSQGPQDCVTVPFDCGKFVGHNEQSPGLPWADLRALATARHTRNVAAVKVPRDDRSEENSVNADREVWHGRRRPDEPLEEEGLDPMALSVLRSGPNKRDMSVVSRQMNGIPNGHRRITFCKPRHDGQCTIGARMRFPDKKRPYIYDLIIFDRLCNIVGFKRRLSLGMSVHEDVHSQLQHYVVVTKTYPQTEFVYAGSGPTSRNGPFDCSYDGDTIKCEQLTFDCGGFTGKDERNDEDPGGIEKDFLPLMAEAIERL